MRPLLLASLCALACIAACSSAPPPQQPPAVHSTPSLVVLQSTAQPGSQVTVGIRFQMDKDWHIYWLNPGDSGEPPRVLWQLPQGVTASALAWPTPVRMPNPAGTDFGYQGDAVLLSTLSVPASVQPGANLPIVADLRWLVCHDICMPQRAELKANLPIAAASVVDPRAQQLLDSASARIPRALPSSFHLTAASSPDHFRLSFVSATKPATALFFPAVPEQIDNAAPQQLSATGSTTQLELKKADNLQRDPARLEGLLVLNGQDSYQVNIPIKVLHHLPPRTSAAPKEKQL
jgi:DsbC/DsbD-like thiol-disulfide interchange protein